MSLVKYINRKKTNCNKWDGQSAMFGEEGLLPFWVADMDFQVADCITDAIKKYTETGVFGYFKIPNSYYDSIIDWEQRYHHCVVEKDWIRFSPGVVAAFHWIVQYNTHPGDSVLVMTPVYYPFFHAVTFNERNLVTSSLKNTDGYYEIDFEDLETKIINEHVTMLIFCSPHNPVGRVWTREELEKLFALCKKHHVTVISDEIHQDLTFGGHQHQSALTFPKYYDQTYVLTAPSKTFNLAACQNSIIIIPDAVLRKKWDAFTEGIRVMGGNAFGYIAAEAAFTYGHEWYAEVKDVIYTNYHYVKETLERELPNVIISPLEGTYLLWIDLHNYAAPGELPELLQKKCGLAFDYGDWFGGDEYATFFRMNLATSMENVKIAVKRIIDEIASPDPQTSSQMQ